MDKFKKWKSAMLYSRVKEMCYRIPSDRLYKTKNR